MGNGVNSVRYPGNGLGSLAGIIKLINHMVRDKIVPGAVNKERRDPGGRSAF